MLTRWVLTVWGAWLGALGLATALTALGIWNSTPIVPVGLSVLMLAALVIVVVVATIRLIHGPRRDRALAGLLLGTAPLWFLIGHIAMATRPAFNLHVAPGWPTKVFSPLARPLVDLGARWFYPQRTPGKWVTMISAHSDGARAQVAAMDRHVEAALARLDQSATWPIAWFRGPVFGLRDCSLYDLAIGSELGSDQRDADGLARIDRHEVAHAVITSNFTARSDPPRVLIEGWAQANQGTSAEELAATAWNDRDIGRGLTLRQLVAPDWYWYSGPAAYTQGAPLVNYLLRVYGPERFLKFYTTCQQATFEADCRSVLGIGLDDLDAAVWADTKRIVQRDGPLSRVWLKGLTLDSSISTTAWDSFLTEYFAAAEYLLAPYTHLRLTTVVRRGRDSEERFELLRSGPFARVRRTEQWDDQVYLANPNGSIEAIRSRRPPAEPWKISENPQASREQSYRLALRRIERVSFSSSEPAIHGGMILLSYPELYRAIGLSTDFEVVKLQTTTSGGRRLVTLRLRTGPEVKGRARSDITFVFDADDFFVIRSAQGREFGESFEVRFDYDHQGDRPILRAITSTNFDPAPPKKSPLLEVTECRFEPIPESEFAPESFLSRLEPDGIVWEKLEGQKLDQPSTATPVDWYWLAFVGGGVSVAAGFGLTLLSRNRDREAPRTA